MGDVGVDLDSANNQDEVVARLLHMGVPQNVIEYALSHGVNRWKYYAVAGLSIVLVLAGFLAIYFVAFPILNAMNETNAIRHAARSNALMFDRNFGLSLLIGFFAWICICGAICCHLPRISKRTMLSNFVFSVFDAPNTAIGKKLVGHAIQSLSSIGDPEQYIRKYVFGWSSILTWSGLLLAVLCALIIYRELNTYDLYTKEAYIRSPVLPWASSKPNPWTSADYVELGCNHVEGKNASDSVIYQVHFRNGVSTRVSSATSINESWLNQMEVIDQKLKNAGATFKRWQWLQRDPLHPACMAAYERVISPADYERLKKLLRVGKLDGAP